MPEKALQESARTRGKALLLSFRTWQQGQVLTYQSSLEEKDGVPGKLAPSEVHGITGLAI